jgi:hypothetical protein
MYAALKTKLKFAISFLEADFIIKPRFFLMSISTPAVYAWSPFIYVNALLSEPPVGVMTCCIGSLKYLKKPPTCTRISPEMGTTRIAGPHYEWWPLSALYR